MRRNDRTKILLDPLVLSFRKSISLGVEGGRQVLLDPKFLSDSFTEVGGETWVSVANNLGRETKPSVHVVEI